MTALRFRSGISDWGVPTSNGTPSQHPIAVTTESHSNMSRVQLDTTYWFGVCAVPSSVFTIKLI